MDSGDQRELEDDVRAMPPSVFKPLSDWVFKTVIDKYLADHGEDVAGDVKCFDAAGKLIIEGPLTLFDLWVCGSR